MTNYLVTFIDIDPVVVEAERVELAYSNVASFEANGRTVAIIHNFSVIREVVLPEPVEVDADDVATVVTEFGRQLGERIGIDFDAVVNGLMSKPII